MEWHHQRLLVAADVEVDAAEIIELFQKDTNEASHTLPIWAGVLWLQFIWWHHNKLHVTHLVCVLNARNCLLCIFVSSPFASPVFPLYPLYHLFLHLSISAPVGIGKRCSSLSSMTPAPTWPPTSGLLKPPDCMPIESTVSILIPPPSMSHLSWYCGGKQATRYDSQSEIIDQSVRAHQRGWQTALLFCFSM